MEDKQSELYIKLKHLLAHYYPEVKRSSATHHQNTDTAKVPIIIETCKPNKTNLKVLQDI